MPLLARALAGAGIEAPVTTALARLIEGELPLDEWVAMVRTTVPPRSAPASAGSPGVLAAARQLSCSSTVRSRSQRAERPLTKATRTNDIFTPK